MTLLPSWRESIWKDIAKDSEVEHQNFSSIQIDKILNLHIKDNTKLALMVRELWVKMVLFTRLMKEWYNPFIYTISHPKHLPLSTTNSSHPHGKSQILASLDYMLLCGVNSHFSYQRIGSVSLPSIWLDYVIFFHQSSIKQQRLENGLVLYLLLWEHHGKEAWVSLLDDETHLTCK